MRRVAPAILAAVLATGCGGPAVVNTGEPPATSRSAEPPAAPAPVNDLRMVSAFDYVAHVDGTAGYYFTTPSGKWACAILPREKAGCQSASGWPSAMGLPGEPDSAADAAGDTGVPNAIIIEREGDGHFAALEAPEFAVDPGPAKALQFDEILVVAGFRCNVQEAGVSCMSEQSGQGFTFSSEGFQMRYTDLPPAP